VSEYAKAMRWVVWEVCDLAAPLDDIPVQELAFALIGYIGCRLADDGIDGHEVFKERTPTLYAALREHCDEREAGALSVLLGYWLLNRAAALSRAHGLQTTADTMLHLSGVIVPGAVAEVLGRHSQSAEEYRAVVSRKSVAYNMLLYQIATRSIVDTTVAQLLLRVLARWAFVAQVLNDLADRDDDAARDRLNVLNTVRGEPAVVLAGLDRELAAIWNASLTLPAPLRNAMASRIHSARRALHAKSA
jgi:hypothetical protein